MTNSVDAEILARLHDVCTIAPFVVDQAIAVGSRDNALQNRPGFANDLTGFEAFISHVHLSDVWEGLAVPRLVDLRTAAEIVIGCWAVNLLPVLANRSVLFFAGGGSVEEFSVRFHVFRGKDDTWANTTDAGFLSARELAVWRFDAAHGLQVIHSW